MAGSASPKLSYAQNILSQGMLRRCSGKLHIDFTLGKDALPLGENQAATLAWALQQDKAVPQSVKFKLASGSLREGELERAFLKAAKNKTTLRKIEVEGGVSDAIQLYLERNHALQFCEKDALSVGSYKIKPTPTQLKALALALQDPQSQVSTVDFSHLDPKINALTLLAEGQVEQEFYNAFNKNTGLVELRIDGDVSDRLKDVVKRNAFLASGRNARALTVSPDDNPSEAHLLRLVSFLNHPKSNVCTIKFEDSILINGDPLNLIDGALEEAFYQLAVSSSQLVCLDCWSGVSSRLQAQLTTNKMRIRINDENGTEKNLTFAKSLSPLEVEKLLDLLAGESANAQLETIAFSALKFNYDFKEGKFEEMLFRVIEANEALYEVKCKGELSDRIKSTLANRKPFCELRHVLAPLEPVSAGEPTWPVLAAVTSAVSSLLWSREAVVDRVPTKAAMPNC